MGDVPPPSGSAQGFERQEAAVPSAHGVDNHAHYTTGYTIPDSAGAVSAPFQQYSTPHHAFAQQLDITQPPASTRPAPYNMSAMANALPQAAYRQAPPYSSQQQQQQQPRYSPANGAANMPGQMPPPPPYGGQAALGPLPNQQFYMTPQPVLAPYYTSPLSPSQQQATMVPRPGMGYYPNPTLMAHQHQQTQPPTYYYTQGGHYSQQAPVLQGQPLAGQFAMRTDSRRMAYPRVSEHLTGLPSQVQGMGDDTRSHPPESRQSVVRGPPRKPRQSGHAIWIGNLPPQTDLMSLVLHVCKEANGLESLFLISKSNCAFANFKDGQTCVSAQQKLHDSNFHSVRLVSRLRKSTVEGAAGVTAPTGPAAAAPHVAVAPKDAQTREDGSAAIAGEKGNRAEAGHLELKPGLVATSHKDRFFILKSLTVEDLELSVRTGIWATQSHNEDTLNKAFKAADNVYLVFSANKSGEYFGYARMSSPVNEDPAAAIEFAPKVQTANDINLPKAIATEATEFAPKGRIIDDSARGTIFWEAEGVDTEMRLEEEEAMGDDSSTEKSAPEGDGTGKAWGKPFRLEWLSTARLPFYRTRGLRNPWNSNREVKIARDGTELEPSVGRRLVSLFNRGQSPAAGALSMPQGVPIPMAPYAPIRPPYQG